MFTTSNLLKDNFSPIFAVFAIILGAIYTPEHTTFRVWSPISSSMKLRIYTLAGAMYGLAGFLLAAKSGGASVNLGLSYELEGTVILLDANDEIIDESLGAGPEKTSF